MGTWGIGVFENDTACDFAEDVATGGGLASLETALDRVLAVGDGPLESPDAAEGLAAADIIARLNGKGGERDAYTASVDEWVDRQKSPPPEELIEKARRCVSRIVTAPSELLELWQESDEFDAWKRSVEAVLGRL